MIPGIKPSADVVHEIEVLLRASHPILLLETHDEARAHAIVTFAAANQRMPRYDWKAHRGLCPAPTPTEPLEGTVKPTEALDWIAKESTPSVWVLGDIEPFIETPPRRALLRELHGKLYGHAGALVFIEGSAEIPPEIEQLVTRVRVAPPTRDEYWEFVKAVLKDLRARTRIDVAIEPALALQLVGLLSGLTMYEAKRIVTRTIVEAGRFDASTLEAVRAAKSQLAEDGGALEYQPADMSMDEVAGLAQLKDWFRKRKAAFLDQARAIEFGLTPPKGILLLGVQGCGKSMCAKAVAADWALPLLKLDAGSLFQKYLGETEANLRRALDTAEAMAPVVLWIDEIEKAFSQGDSDEGGTSKRVFGALLSWLQDKESSVFVVATANDVSRLPPELLRKGRFDEIFFVDLPGPDARRAIFEVHLRRRRRDPATFDLDALTAASSGFSGAEIEQAIVAALYTAFAQSSDLTTEILQRELHQTRPLSVTMAEPIQELRDWAKDRVVPAD